MASFLGNNQSVAVPQSLQGNDSQMAMKGAVKQVAVPCSTGNQTGNGKLLFTLPSNNVSITRRSMFLKARISLSYAQTLPLFTNGGATTWVVLQGPGQGQTTQGLGGANVENASNNSVGSNGTNTLANGYSIIQRSTVSCGGKVIDDINYVCDLMSGLILPHNTNPQWLTTDGSNLMAIGQAANKSTTLTTGGFVYWDVCLPMPHSCFNSETDFPLYLLSSDNPLSVEINLTPITRAIRYGTLAVPIGNDYTVSRISLCYETISLPIEFTDSMRQRIKSSPFVIPQSSYLITQMPISALANYNVGLNMSSLKAVYILPTNTSTYSSNNITTGANGITLQYSRTSANDFTVAGTTADFSGTNVQLFCNNNLINTVNLDNSIATFTALKQALNGSIADYLKPSICTRLNYIYNHYAIGINTTNFSDNSTIMCGTEAKDAQIILTNFTTNTGNLANIIFNYDSLIIIKNGKITTKR